MFTGIVETMGVVTGLHSTDLGAVLVIDAPSVAEGLAVGGSIAVNGTCLTATNVEGPAFSVDAVAETLARTALGSLSEGDRVNLERPLAATGRFDGHIVQGHVDGTSEVLAFEPEGDGARLTVALPPLLARYIVEKGSITVDGVSLTVAALGSDSFQIAVIPHTLEATILGERRPGDAVNLEVDVIAKYVERLMEKSR